jgi:dienelactone hydrolase
MASCTCNDSRFPEVGQHVRHHPRTRQARIAYVAGLIVLIAAGCGRPEPVNAQGDPPRAPLSLFAYDRSAPLAVELAPMQWEERALDLFRIAFASPGGGRVTGFLAVPKVPGPHAGLVAMHGLPGNAEGSMMTVGREVARRGAVVLAIDAPWTRRNGLPEFTPRDSAEQVQLIQDLSRAVDVLLSRSDVDKARIGYVGGSYGGAMGALFVGIERRLRAAVLFVPDGGLVSHFTNADGSVTGPLSGISEAARARWLAAMRPIEPIRFIDGARGTAVLYQNGRTDALVTVEDAEALHAAAPEPKTIRWYDAGHGLTAAAREDRLTQ